MVHAVTFLAVHAVVIINPTHSALLRKKKSRFKKHLESYFIQIWTRPPEPIQEPLEKPEGFPPQ